MSFGFGVNDFIAVLELAGKLRQRWVDAPMEYASLRAGVRNVENILKTLVELVDQVEIDTQQKSNFEDAGAHCASVLCRANEIADKYSLLQNDGGTFRGRVRRNWKRFRADPEDIRHLRDQLTAVVTQLGAIQNNIEIDMVQEISEDIDDLRISDKQQKKTQIANWYASSSYAEQQSDQLALRHAGTGIWFLRSPQYLDWRLGVNKTLICPGIPGSGKTIIVATVVDDLRQYFGQQKDVLVVYFYFNCRRASEQNLDQILAALIRQLFQEQPDTPQPVDELYRSHKDRNTKPSVDELKALLRLLVQDYAKLFFVTDALDECMNDNRSRDKLLDELFSLQTQLTSDINLLFTSGFIPEITNRFQSAIQIEITAQKQDIEVYLDGRMPELCSGVRKNKKLQHDIKAKITAIVDGMFLLARLHFESLQDKMTPRAVQKALESLPKGPGALNVAYEEAMARINQQREGFRQMARKILAWIVFARQELSIQELQEAVAIESGMEGIDHENDLVESDEMVSICAGLVTIDQESQVARLVHYTTQEFFELMKEQWLPEGEALVARACIDYLCMEVFEPIPRAFRMAKKMLKHHEVFKAYKLLPYVGRNWGFHASLLDVGEEYVKAILCDVEKLIFVNQLVCINSYDRPAHNVSGVHICARFDDTKAARFMLENGADSNQTDSYGRTPLLWAVEYGSMNMVELLLSQPGIDVNLRYPLSRAAARGYKEIVALLLALPGIDVNLGYPLSRAAAQGHREIVELLLSQQDIDVNLRDPLYWAAAEGHKEIIELLIDRSDIDVNLGQPLSRAVDGGYKEIIELLLDHPDVEVNLGQPLSKAVDGGYQDIVELLLVQPGINVNLRYPLSRAAARGHKEIVKILLSHPDVDVNFKYPLSSAVTEGRTEIVKILLSQPKVDVNLGYTLSSAAAEGHKEIVEILLARPDVDVNLGSPLSKALAEGHQEIVELLLRQPNIHVHPGDLACEVTDRSCKDVGELISNRSISMDQDLKRAGTNIDQRKTGTDSATTPEQQSIQRPPMQRQRKLRHKEKSYQGSSFTKIVTHTPYSIPTSTNSPYHSLPLIPNAIS